HRNVTTANQVRRQPSNQEIERVVGAELSQARAPSRPLSQNIENPNGDFAHWGGRSSTARHPAYPGDQPQQCSQAQDQEERPPAKATHYVAADKNTEGGTQSKASHDGGIRETAATLGEVGAKNLAIGGKS